MRPYEIMIIFDVELEQNDIAQRVDRVTEMVKSGGGTPGLVDHWGRRTFAYELDHRTEGYYVLVEMAAEPATMSEIDRMLIIDDGVLRHKIMRQPERVAGRTRSSSASRRPGSRGPGSSGRGPSGGRSPDGRRTAVSSGGPRPTGPAVGGIDADQVSVEPIEGAAPPAVPSDNPSVHQEPATS